MLASKVLTRVSRTVGGRSLLLASASKKLQLTNQYQNIVYASPNKLIPSQVSLSQNSGFSSFSFQRFGFSSASPETKEKENENATENDGAEPTKPNEDVKASEEAKESGSNSEPRQPGKRRRSSTKRTAFFDSDSSESESESELSREELVKRLADKEELLKAKHQEIETMKDKVLRSYAEMENAKDRTRREAENSKKFAIQNFAKNLLDVADNLARASSVVKESFSKIDTSKDSTGAVPLLKSLLEGVEMTEKQLAEAFRKSGVEKFDPSNEPFDPHRHNAVFQVPDNSKPPGTVAHVLKMGYMLYDRVLRPAEVGVTVENNAAENNEDKSSGA